ncbi:MAG TPA: hypothetical protein VKX25_18810 [Bryobacteraceae bacterium]|jgi:hypothetical protein|nr:hypothetical protein [Bryobacteraceae bacterium]
MKHNYVCKGRSYTKPLLNELVKQQHDAYKRTIRLASTGSSNSPIVESTPVAPANLYQDAGGGYNTNYTYMQV